MKLVLLVFKNRRKICRNVFHNEEPRRALKQPLALRTEVGSNENTVWVCENAHNSASKFAWLGISNYN